MLTLALLGQAKRHFARHSRACACTCTCIRVYTCVYAKLQRKIRNISTHAFALLRQAKRRFVSSSEAIVSICSVCSAK